MRDQPDPDGEQTVEPDAILSRDDVRILLLKERTELTKIAIAAIYQRRVSTANWILTSLLALNGGALLAMLASSRYGAILLPVSANLLIWGIVLAYIAGVMNWRATRGLIAMEQYWMEAMWDAVAPGEETANDRPRFTADKLWFALAGWVGVASFGSFVVAITRAKEAFETVAY